MRSWKDINAGITDAAVLKAFQIAWDLEAIKRNEAAIFKSI